MRKSLRKDLESTKKPGISFLHEADGLLKNEEEFELLEEVEESIPSTTGRVQKQKFPLNYFAGFQDTVSVMVYFKMHGLTYFKSAKREALPNDLVSWTYA